MRMYFKLFILSFVIILSSFDTSGQIGIFKKKKEDEKQLKSEEIKKTLVLPDTVNRINHLKKKSYNIALLLPFYLDSLNFFTSKKKEFEYEQITDEEEQEIEIIEDITDRIKIYPKSRMSISFYEGMLIALDSLQKLGFNCKLIVYDTGNDTNEVKFIRSKLIKDSLDLIIGPVYNSSIKLMTDFAKNYKIPIVSPLGTNPEHLKENPYFILAKPSPQTQFEFIAHFVYKKHKHDNILMIIYDKAIETKVTGNFKKSFNVLNKTNFSNDPQKIIKPFFKEVYYSDNDKRSLLSALSDTMKNILIVPSVNEAHVGKLLNYLDSKPNKQITIIGLPDWAKFETIESDKLEKFNVHLPSSYFINPELQEVKNFRIKYRNAYNTEPNKYAYQGYDVGLFYFYGLLTYGNGFIDNIEKLKIQGLHNYYNHTSLGIKFGHENSSVFILKFQDYKFIKVN